MRSCIKVAAVMNGNFINIKVDREERPDVDKVYMTFVQVKVILLVAVALKCNHCTEFTYLACPRLCYCLRKYLF